MIREFLESLFYNHFGFLVVAIAITLLALTIESVWHKPEKFSPEENAERPHEPKSEAKEVAVQKVPVERVENVIEEVVHHDED